MLGLLGYLFPAELGGRVEGVDCVTTEASMKAHGRRGILSVLRV